MKKVLSIIMDNIAITAVTSVAIVLLTLGLISKWNEEDSTRIMVQDAYRKGYRDAVQATVEQVNLGLLDGSSMTRVAGAARFDQRGPSVQVEVSSVLKKPDGTDVENGEISVGQPSSRKDSPEK